jgi:hypothetical protein
MQEEKFGLPRTDPSLLLVKEKEIETDSTQLKPAEVIDQPLFQFIGTLPVMPKPEETKKRKKAATKVLLPFSSLSLRF